MHRLIGALAVAALAPAVAHAFPPEPDGGTVILGCSGTSGSITDPTNGMPHADADFSAFGWNMAGGVLTIEMVLPALVQPLPVNRDGIDGPLKEYEWGVAIDSDARATTGERSGLFEGADYVLSVSYFHQSTIVGFLDLADMQHDVWKANRVQGTRTAISVATIEADPAEQQFELAGPIPGLSASSRLMPFTWWLDPASGLAHLDISSGCSFLNPDTVFREGFEN